MANISASASTVVSAGTWTSAANVYLSDNTYATNPGTTQNTEYPMEVGGFNFAAIPAGSTITSVTVTIEAKSGTNNRAQIRAELLDGGTLLSGVLALTNVTNADVNYTFTPTVTLAQLKSANLKVRVVNKRIVSQANVTSVDYVKIDVVYSPPQPDITQAAYQWFNEGTESGAAPYVAQNTAVTGDLSNGDATGTLRIRLQSTTAVDVPTTDDWQLQFEWNSSGSWVTISAVDPMVATYDSTNLTNGQATTNRLTGGSGTFVAGKVSEDSLMDDLGWAGNNYTELVYALKIKAANLANGDTLRFRVLRNLSTATMTYAVTPVINLIKTLAYSVSPALSGSGSLSASMAPSLAVAPNLSGSGTLTATGTVPSGPFEDPSDITGLVIWLDPSDLSTITASGNNVSEWRDKSATGRTLAPPRIPPQVPHTGTRTVNGLNAIEFADGGLKAVPFALPQPVTIIAVAQTDVIDSQNRQVVGNWAPPDNPTIYITSNTWHLWAGSDLDSGVFIDTSPHITTGVFNGSASQLRIDGTLVLTGTLPTLGFENALGIGEGGGSGYFWDGLIGEIVIYNRVLTETEYTDVEDYLTAKWLVPSGTEDYTTTAPLSGSGSLSASVAPQAVTAASLSGGGTLAATVAPKAVVAPALSGGGTLAAALVPKPVVAPALSGAGALSAGAAPTVTVAPALSGGGALSALVAPKPTSTAPLSGGGTLSVTALPTVTTPAALSGSGTLVAVPSTGAATPASLSGAGVLSASVVPKPTAVATLSGSGSLSAVTTEAFTTTVALSGSGTLTAIGSSTEFATAFPALSGSGALVAAMAPNLLVAPVLTGVGTLIASAAAEAPTPFIGWGVPNVYGP